MISPKYLTIFLFTNLSFGIDLKEQNQNLISGIDSIYFKLDPIDVTAFRKSYLNPISETLISGNRIETFNVSSSLNTVLRNVPGLFALSDFNNAQDSRISIRGFGARSNFGIRGIKILVDGIPESTPDGQGQIDNISANYFDQICVLRASTSILFGNASGGAISFSSRTPKNYNYTKYSFIGNSLNDNALMYFINRSKNYLDWNIQADIENQKGHRDHSASQSIIFNSQLKYRWKYFETFILSFNHLYSPYALDPGGLTSSQSIDNPKMARMENQLYDARESVMQSKLSLRTEKYINKKLLLKTDLWFMHRIFDNKLPFQNGGQVDLIRNYYGLNSKLIHHINFGKTFNKVMFGIEMSNLFDSRKRYDNLKGTRGNMVYDSYEKFLMGASYLQCQTILDNHQLYFGTRIDYNQIKFEDKFFESDSLDYRTDYKNLTPLFGYKYQFNKKLSSFVNYTTHFETPTLYEIGNSFGLKPQRSVVGEIGFIRENNRSEYSEIVFFKSKITNEIIPFEMENEPGRSFFENAGSTKREGLELSIRKKITQKSNLQFTHTFTDYRFINFNSNGNVLNGNYFPAIPRYYGKLNFLNDLNRNIEFDLEIYYAGKVFLDDNNTASNKSYMLTSLNIKRKLIIFERLATIFCYIENIFDTPYSSNIRMNAWGDRFFEPGPTRRYTIGIKF